MLTLNLNDGCIRPMQNMVFIYSYTSVNQGCTDFPKIWEQAQNSRCQKGAMKQLSCIRHKYKVPWQPGACDLCTPSLAIDIQEDENLQNGGCSCIP